MAFILRQFQHAGAPPSLDQVRRRFGLREGELDPTFGVVLIDPRDSTYAIMVEASANDEVGSRPSRGDEDAGVLTEYENPEILPFDLQAPTEDDAELD